MSGFLLSNGGRSGKAPDTLPATIGVSTGSDAQKGSSINTEAPGAVPNLQNELSGNNAGATPDTAAVSWTAADTAWLTAVLLPTPGMPDLRLEGEVEEALQLWCALSTRWNDGLFKPPAPVFLSERASAPGKCRLKCLGCPTARAGRALSFWFEAGKAKQVLLPACQWCGLPTGNFCEGCSGPHCAICEDQCDLTACRKCCRAGPNDLPKELSEILGA